MTFSKLTWLKRTDGHKFTGAEFRVLIALFNHSDQHGRKAHPGIKRMMAETGYGKAAVSEAVTALKQRGWITEVHKGSGVSGNASVFDLVPDAPRPPSSSPGGEQPTEASSSSVDEQLPVSSSPVADSCSSGANQVVRLEQYPSDPGSDPKDQILLSDPREVRYPPNHGPTRVETPAGSLSMDERSKDREQARSDFTDEDLAAIAAEVYESEPEPEAPGVSHLFDSPMEAEGARRLLDAAPLLAQHALHTTGLDRDRNNAVVRRLLDAGVLDLAETDDDEGNRTKMLTPVNRGA